MKADLPELDQGSVKSLSISTVCFLNSFKATDEFGMITTLIVSIFQRSVCMENEFKVLEENLVNK